MRTKVYEICLMDIVTISFKGRTATEKNVSKSGESRDEY